jgi:hypothetical protein
MARSPAARARLSAGRVLVCDSNMDGLLVNPAGPPRPKALPLEVCIAARDAT